MKKLFIICLFLLFYSSVAISEENPTADRKRAIEYLKPILASINFPNFYFLDTDFCPDEAEQKETDGRALDFVKCFLEIRANLYSLTPELIQDMNYHLIKIAGKKYFFRMFKQKIAPDKYAYYYSIGNVGVPIIHICYSDEKWESNFLKHEIEIPKGLTVIYEFIRRGESENSEEIIVFDENEITVPCWLNPDPNIETDLIERSVKQLVSPISLNDFDFNAHVRVFPDTSFLFKDAPMCVVKSVVN